MRGVWASVLPCIPLVWLTNKSLINSPASTSSAFYFHHGCCCSSCCGSDDGGPSQWWGCCHLASCGCSGSIRCRQLLWHQGIGWESLHQLSGVCQFLQALTVSTCRFGLCSSSHQLQAASFLHQLQLLWLHLQDLLIVFSASDFQGVELVFLIQN